MLPLTHGMAGLRLDGRALEIFPVPPSQMTQLMDDGKLDIGMLPVGALIERRDCPIIGKSMIGSDGPVRSVILAGWGEPTGWRVLHPDSQSRSSNALAQVLLRRFMGCDPSLADPIPMNDLWEPPIGSPSDEAYVLIGTRALRWREYWETRGGVVLDMGAEWKRQTGLPFVFAAWVARSDLDLVGNRIEEWMALFEGLKRQNMPHLPEIITTWPGLELERQTPAEALSYLTENIKFDLDDRARSGLSRFLSEARSIL